MRQCEQSWFRTVGIGGAARRVCLGYCSFGRHDATATGARHSRQQGSSDYRYDHKGHYHNTTAERADYNSENTATYYAIDNDEWARSWYVAETASRFGIADDDNLVDNSTDYSTGYSADNWCADDNKTTTKQSYRLASCRWHSDLLFCRGWRN